MSAERQRGGRARENRKRSEESGLTGQCTTAILPRQETDTYPRLFSNVKFQPSNPDNILRQIIPDIDILLGRPSARCFVDDRSLRTGRSFLCVGFT